ncbi:MAG TPA: hypothetical protein VF556_02880 [Pyrinomonadaceae bacterium]
MTSTVQLQKMRRAKKRPAFVWLIPTQLMALATAAGAAAGENLLRLVLLGGMLSTMLVPLMISLEAGLMAIMIFEPFRGFLRRAQYILVPYSQTEPIHMLVPIATICAFLIVLFRHKLEIIRLTPLAGWTTALAAICFVQMFNPLQGSLFVGFSGGLFYLVPMAWFYFGQTVREDFVPKLLRVIIVLGLITSLYGVYQLIFGYPFFEKYWIDNTDLYNSIAVEKIQRALATFNNSEEWGRYIQIGCTIALGLGICHEEGNKRIVWLAAAGLLFLMIAFTGQRTSIFGVILSGGVLFLTGARSFQGLMARLMIMVAPVVLLAALSKPMSDDSGSDLSEDDRVGTMLNHTTKGTVNPTGEGSLEARFDTWTQVITKDIPSNPVGTGLGAYTLAGSREQVDNGLPIDNHFFSLALSAGVPAMLLLVMIMVRATVFCYRGWRLSKPGTKKENLWRIMLALMAAFILNNFFGTSFTIYSIAPIGWLLIGWISANYVKEAEILARLNAAKKPSHWNGAANTSF